MAKVDDMDRPVNVGNPQMGWASDVAAEMLRRMGIKYLSMNPGASYRGFHDSIVNYSGTAIPRCSSVCMRIMRFTSPRAMPRRRTNPWAASCIPMWG